MPLILGRAVPRSGTPADVAAFLEELRRDLLSATAGDLGAITSQQLDATMTRGAVRVTKSANQTVTAGTDTPVTWNQEAFDADGFHDPVTNTSRLTVPAGFGGTYLMVATLNTDSGGAVQAKLRVNGTTVIAVASAATADATRTSAPTVSALYRLAAGDYVQAVVNMVGGTPAVVATGSALQMKFVGV
jgi:hypothetical protein